MATENPVSHEQKAPSERPRIIDLLNQIAPLSEIRAAIKNNVAESAEDLSFALYHWLDHQDLSTPERKKEAAEFVNLLGSMTGEGLFARGKPCYMAVSAGKALPGGRFYLTSPGAKTQVDQSVNFRSLTPVVFDRGQATRVTTFTNWQELVESMHASGQTSGQAK